MTNYKCNRCDKYETNKFSDMIKHFSRKHCCKKLESKIFLSDDQILCLSIIPYTNNNHNIEENETQHLEKSNLIDYNKKELFDELDIIEKNKCKICKYCNKNFLLINDLKKHIIINCFIKYLQNKVIENNEQKDMNNSNTNINNNNIDTENSNLYNKCDMTNSKNTNINTLNNVNNNNINNNIYFDIKPVQFNEDWDISKISNGDKGNIMISQFMYTELLEEILKNSANLNVIIDKEKDTGLVYKNDQYIQMNLKDIVSNTMEKLNEHLNHINKTHPNTFKEIITFSRQMINKKYIDFVNNTDIQNGVGECMSNIYEKVKPEATNIAKTVIKNKESLKREGKKIGGF